MFSMVKNLIVLKCITGKVCVLKTVLTHANMDNQ